MNLKWNSVIFTRGKYCVFLLQKIIRRKTRFIRSFHGNLAMDILNQNTLVSGETIRVISQPPIIFPGGEVGLAKFLMGLLKIFSSMGRMAVAPDFHEL